MKELIFKISFFLGVISWLTDIAEYYVEVETPMVFLISAY